MFSKHLEMSISQAYQDARSARHEYLTVEHLLLALLDNGSAVSILQACGANLDKLDKELRQVLEETVPLMAEEDSRDTSRKPGHCGYVPFLLSTRA